MYDSRQVVEASMRGAQGSFVAKAILTRDFRGVKMADLVGTGSHWVISQIQQLISQIGNRRNLFFNLRNHAN